MSRPFFTLAIPTFNRAPMLRGAISSALQQTCGDFELLISDNCSTDDTPQVVASFNDPRLRYIRQEQNLGPLRNFDTLLRESKGEYFVLHQDDDALACDFLAHAKATLDLRPQVVMYGAPQWFGNHVSGFTATLLPMTLQAIAAGQASVFNGRQFAVYFLHQTPILSPAIAFKRESLLRVGGFTMDMPYGADIVTQTMVALLGDVALSPVIGGAFRHHPSSYSKAISRSNRRRSFIWMYDQLIKHLDEQGVEWQTILDEQLGAYDDAQLLALLRKWVRDSDHPRLQLAAWRRLRRTWKRSTLSLWTRSAQQIGWMRTLKLASQQ